MNENARIEIINKKYPQWINSGLVKDYLRYLEKNDLLFDGYKKDTEQKIKVSFATVWTVYDTLCELENRFIQKDYRKSDKSFYHSQTDIAEKCCITTRIVRRAIKILEKYNIIQVVRYKYNPELDKTNDYILIEPTRINFHKGFICELDSHSMRNQIPYGQESESYLLKKDLIKKEREKREKNNKNSPPKEKEIKQSEKINNTIYELYLARKKEFLQTYNNLMYQARGVNLISKADEFYTFRNSYNRAKKDKRENQIINQDEFRKRAINYLDSTAEPYKQKSFKQFIKLIENFDEKQNLYNEKQEHDIYANLEII